MKKIYSILLFCCLSVVVWGQDLLSQANEAYSQENYKKAIELYEKVAQDEGVSSELYYNMGNAYYKDKQYPKAILNYERALLLSPGNDDVRFNLEMANSHITDKVEPVGTFFLSVWIHSLRDSLSSNSWAVLAIVCFLFFVAGIYLYFFTRNVLLRKIGFFAGSVLLLISVLSNNFASEQKDKITERNEAIVFAPTITIKSSPAESGTDLFVLHEGTKVKLLDKVGEWSEILLADGNRGWMPTNQLEII
ncbi:tetratricopeptide repeat protein [Coprobacter sp.]